MKVRVGIDLDDNHWVDWEGNNPPNLIPNPLWFNALPKADANNVTLTDRMEQNPYGLVIRRMVGTGEIFTYFRFGFSPGAAIPVAPLTTYTYVVWARKLDPSSPAVYLDVVDQEVFVWRSADMDVGSDWTRLSLTFTTNIDSTEVSLGFVQDPGNPVAGDYELTGLGLYLGDTNMSFNSGTTLGHLEDISDYVLSLRCDSGSTADITNMTPIDGQLEVTLRNDERVWSPRNTESLYHGLLKPQTLVEVRASVDEIHWELIWTGFYESIAMTAGTSRNKQATLKAVQGLLYMDDDRVRYRPQENKTTTEILESILPQTMIPANRFTWRLGVGRLGINTAFPAIDAFADLDDTEYVHPVAGAGLTADATIRTYLNDLIRNEGGFAFYDRSGRLVFRSRDRLFPSIFDVE